MIWFEGIKLRTDWWSKVIYCKLSSGYDLVTEPVNIFGDRDFQAIKAAAKFPNRKQFLPSQR